MAVAGVLKIMSPELVERRVYQIYPPEAADWVREQGIPQPPSEYDSTVGQGTTFSVLLPASSRIVMAPAAVRAVLTPLTVAKQFAPATIAVGGSSTLTISLTNPNAVALQGVAFTDTYPASIANAASPNTGVSGPGCSGTRAATAVNLSAQ